MSDSLNAEQLLRFNPMFRFQWEKAQDAYVLLYPEGMVKLNGPAGEILAEVDGQRTPAQLIEVLQQRYPDADTLAEDVTEFLIQAISQGWLVQSGAAS